MSSLFYVTFNIKAKAQSAEDSVKGVITQMFSAMKSSDAATLKRVFADSALLQTITKSKEGKTSVKNEPINDFIYVIGKQPPGATDERIEFESIKIEGALAAVWAPYKFYFNGQFIHCRVNSLQLVRIDNAWNPVYYGHKKKRRLRVSEVEEELQSFSSQPKLNFL